MVTNRMQKFDELILREVSEELRLLFPDQIVTVTQVHISKDLSFAKVWVSAINNIEKVINTCRIEAPRIRTVLAKRIVARRVPSLYFVGDLTEEKASKIEKILNEIKEK